MFEIGDKAKWNGAEVTILNRSEMNVLRGKVYRYSFISPTGNYISNVPENELTK